MKGGTRVAGADPVLREGSARCCDESPPTAPLLRRRRRKSREEEPLLESERDKRGRLNRLSPTKFRRIEAADIWCLIERASSLLHCGHFRPLGNLFLIRRCVLAHFLPFCI